MNISKGTKSKISILRHCGNTRIVVVLKQNCANTHRNDDKKIRNVREKNINETTRNSVLLCFFLHFQVQYRLEQN